MTQRQGDAHHVHSALMHPTQLGKSPNADLMGVYLGVREQFEIYKFHIIEKLFYRFGSLPPAIFLRNSWLPGTSGGIAAFLFCGQFWSVPNFVST